MLGFHTTIEVAEEALPCSWRVGLMVVRLRVLTAVASVDAAGGCRIHELFFIAKASPGYICLVLLPSFPDL